MKTKSGLEIQNFKKLRTPIAHGILETHIYEGTIVGVPLKTSQDGATIDFYCTWDKFGRCSNFEREDCFIDVAQINS